MCRDISQSVHGHKSPARLESRASGCVAYARACEPSWDSEGEIDNNKKKNDDYLYSNGECTTGGWHTLVPELQCKGVVRRGRNMALRVPLVAHAVLVDG